MNRLLTGCIAAACVVALAGCGKSNARVPAAAGSAGTVADLHTITTRGTGKIKTTPDMATINIGVSTKAASASDALSRNNSETKTLIDKLKGGGVAEKDIQTSDISVSPHYNTGGRPDGYEVTNTVNATLRDLGKAGQVIDSAAQAVGDDVRIQGISFGVADDTAARAKARADAVRQARAQADQIASAAKVSVGTVRTISEVSQDSPMPYYSGARAATAFDSSVPISTGQVDIGVSVDVTYDIG